MANLIGSGINQISVNGMLGNLAFQDKSFVSVDKIGIGTTAVDTGTANQTLQNYGGAYVSGSVGIGITLPVGVTPGSTQTLHLDGTTAALRVGPYYSDGAGDRDNILLVASSSDTYIRSNNERFHIYNSAGDILFHGSSDVERVRITGGGQLLVGSATTTGTASQNLQVTGGAYVSGNLGIGTTNPLGPLQVSAATSTFIVTGIGSVGIGTTDPTAKLDVSGDLNGTAFESYELDDISSAVDGAENTFIPTFNYDRVTIANPFRLMVTVNGIPQSAFINNTDYVHQSNFLGSNNGFTIDTDNNIKFTESIPLGSDIVARVLPVSNTATRIKFYPFKPADILLGY